MFPVDSLAPQYCEERAADEAAKRLAQEQQRAAEATQVRAPVATKHAVPSSLAQSLQPSLSRVGSSGVLGNIFQGFRRTASSTPSPAASLAPSRTQTPVLQPSADVAKAEMEARKRDTDICALPGWH